ncbi:MAG: hypothetical protein LWY06_13375 [Firmicutes bacterium]|nr:hypothetical protein [Bacillota bacterium]
MNHTIEFLMIIRMIISTIGIVTGFAIIMFYKKMPAIRDFFMERMVLFRILLFMLLLNSLNFIYFVVRIYDFGFLGKLHNADAEYSAVIAVAGIIKFVGAFCISGINIYISSFLFVKNPLNIFNLLQHRQIKLMEIIIINIGLIVAIAGLLPLAILLILKL